MQIIKKNNTEIAVFRETSAILYDEQSALDLIGELVFNKRIACLVIPMEVLSDPFFDLSTGLAGNILQKFVNYGVRLAIVGDFSAYHSRSLHQFILESNSSTHVLFAASVEEAVNSFSLP